MTIMCRLLFCAQSIGAARGALVQPIFVPAGQELRVTLS